MAPSTPSSSPDPTQDAPERDAFDAWHDVKWPEPQPTDPMHWRVKWRANKRERREIWDAGHAAGRVFDPDAVERAARAIALAESWDGWDTDSHTPNGNTPQEQREWCLELAERALAAANPDPSPTGGPRGPGKR